MPSRTGMSLRLFWENGWNSSLLNFRWVEGSFPRPYPHKRGVSCPSVFLFSPLTLVVLLQTLKPDSFSTSSVLLLLYSHRFVHLIPLSGEFKADVLHISFLTDRKRHRERSASCIWISTEALRGHASMLLFTLTCENSKSGLIYLTLRWYCVIYFNHFLKIFIN